LSHSFGTKRGDRVLSVHGEDAVNTISPLDSLAAEISNTAYVASATEWRESNIVRWFNTFQDVFPKNVREMSPDEAFAYFLDPSKRGQLVKQGKTATTAENVHQYIVSQMQIATDEEKSFIGVMRLISENIEGKTGWWDLLENGGKVSLHPSIGNFQIPCKTHYFIKDNKINLRIEYNDILLIKKITLFDLIDCLKKIADEEIIYSYKGCILFFHNNSLI
jgi:hypothetical protein